MSPDGSSLDPPGTLPEGPALRRLPLVPLHTVLFPGAALPLSIFERRYRQMIGECLESEPPEFGVVLLKAGDEVLEDALTGELRGRPPVPHEVGTVARIVDSLRLPDGRLHLVCLGVRRLRVCELVQELPYLVAGVALLVDEDEACGDAALLDLAAGVRAAVQLQALVHRMPVRPSELSFFVPRTLSTATTAELQQLLEAPSARERLRLELPFLAREQQVLRQLLYLGRQGLPGRGFGGIMPT
jgi:Lon protease-like protein